MLLVTVGLGSCSIATEVEVFNNSGSPVQFVIDNNESNLEPREIKTFYEHEFRQVEVEIEGVRWTYQPRSYIPESFIVWQGWGWWQSRLARVQLESDYKIWLLGVDQTFPVSSFVDQPDGFPVEPKML